MQFFYFKNYLFLSDQRHQIWHTTNISDARASTQACRVQAKLRIFHGVSDTQSANEAHPHSCACFMKCFKWTKMLMHSFLITLVFLIGSYL